MVLTPVELESKEFSRAMRGYNSEEVDKFLKNVLKEYEALYRENKELKDAYSRAMQELEKYKNLENTITKTLVTAQKAAEDARKNAQKEAELIIREARLKGDELLA
ncbi:MAG TPA: DivIVA domain-containing protein, partial [Clostridia bacterium]|nr:DivIVA domain-containing protein [Clostridia bacterium]